MDINAWELSSRHEILGENDGAAFVTPPGSNHDFESWADVIGNTPNTGARKHSISLRLANFGPEGDADLICTSCLVISKFPFMPNQPKSVDISQSTKVKYRTEMIGNFSQTPAGLRRKLGLR